MLVKMYHDKPWEQAGASVADVPEEAVEHWKAHGWYLKEDESNDKVDEGSKKKSRKKA